jgi:ankyrin repeat protein
MGIDDHDTFTGLTQLQAAAADGNVAKVVELLDAGADANIQANGEVRSRFSFRRRGVDPRCLPWPLLQTGPREHTQLTVNILPSLTLTPYPQNSGKTAAMIAASNGSTEILKAMGRGPSLLDLKDADGGTAAMTAAVHKHSSVLDFVSTTTHRLFDSPTSFSRALPFASVHARSAPRSGRIQKNPRGDFQSVGGFSVFAVTLT